MNRILDVIGVIFLLAGLASLIILLYKMSEHVISAGEVIGYVVVMIVSIVIGVVHILLAGFIGPRKY